MSTRTQTQMKAAPKPSFTPTQSGLLQRKCACGGTAGMSGECEECSKEKRFRLQTKLKVNEPGDIYEQEADRIADQVMTTPAHPGVSGAPPHIQRFSGQSNGQMDAAPASVDQALASPGRPLESTLRQDMEQRFGHNFSQVRVHSGAAAEQSARDVNAHAYTVGHDIVFGAGRFAPGRHEGRRLIAHELTHVRQQSTGQITEVVQRQPNKDDWSSFESTYGDDPRFVFWAKRHGKPPANYGEFVALLDEYKKAMKMNPKGVLEEYDRAQLEQDRSELEKRRQAARAAEVRAAEAKPELRQKNREQARQRNRDRLYTAIQKAWSERRRYADAELLKQAESIVAHRVPLPKALLHGLHWKSDQQRWVFIYYYYREYIRVHPESFVNPSADDTELLQYAVLAEEDYLETSAMEAEAAELAQYRKGIPRAARTEQIKKLAATRPMNPLEDFEPGIHDYAPYQGQPQSVDVDIVSGDFDADNLTIKYSDGKELDIPLGKNLLFPNKPLDPKKVLRIFTRRHKKSQRLIPFVVYENTLGVDLDVLSEEDLALMGLPRFDPVLTPVTMYFLSPEFKMHKATLGALQVASLHAVGLGLRQLGVPLASSTLGTGGTLVTGAARLGTAAARQVSFAVNTYGYSSVAATYLGRTAFTYYRINALQINTLGLMGTDIAINLGGGDTGPVSPGDQVSMVVAEVKAVAKGAKNYWKLIEGEVKVVNLASKEAIVRITNVGDIAEKTAKAEYDLGKKLALIRQPAGKQPIKPVADPAKVAAEKPAASGHVDDPAAGKATPAGDIDSPSRPGGRTTGPVEDIRATSERTPFDMKQVGAETEAPQMLGSNFNDVHLKPGQDALYILRDADGTVLKVGKTSANGAKGRFSVYKRAGKLTGKDLQLEVYPLKSGTRNAEFYETALRRKMESAGHKMPWDNTGQRLGYSGFGTPGEGLRKSPVTRGEMKELLEIHKGNLWEVGKELGVHQRTADLWAKSLGLSPKDFK